mgnify:CR=1 FL=1
MNNPVLTKEEAESVRYDDIGYHRFYCNSCKGYVLVKSSFFDRRFCVVCNEVIK